MEPIKILIVEDEAGMRMGVARVLRDFRFRLPEGDEEVPCLLDEAENGETAIAKIDADPPDLLLLDYKLPGLSGLDVLDHVAGKKLHTLTILVTAYASIETAVRATKHGAYDILPKPFSPDELRSVLHRAASRLILGRQARRLAEEKRQIRFQFISVLAHELQAPLGAIDGYLTILKEHSAGDDPAVYENILARSLDRIEGMRKMIRDLLDLTRIESGQKQRELAPLDVAEVARLAIEAIQGEAQRRAITIALEAPEPLTLTADRGEIEIIFNNLLTNAVKYNVEGGRIEVRLRGGEGEVTIAVRDTGIGLTAEECARLFNDFVRIKSARTREILGSGLGLSIVKKLALLYHGEVTVESEPDQGSTFQVHLRQSQ